MQLTSFIPSQVSIRIGWQNSCWSMGKSGTSLEAELDDFMARLYKKYVPSQTREYIESRESSEEPARPKSGKLARTTEPIQAEEVE